MIADVLMPTYNLKEYSNNYEKKSVGLQQSCKDDANDNMTDFESFKFKSRFTNISNDTGIANVEIVVPLTCLRYFF